MKKIIFAIVSLGLAHSAHAQNASRPANTPTRTVEIKQQPAVKNSNPQTSQQRPTTPSPDDILVTGRAPRTVEPKPTVSAAPLTIINLPPLDFVPPEPHALTSEELRTMYDEMLVLNRVSYAEFKPRLRRAKYLQYTFEFSPNAKRREREVRAYLELTVRAIKVDKSAESLEYFHNAYEIYKEDFDKGMAQLTPKKRAELIAADAEARRLNESDDQDNND